MRGPKTFCLRLVCAPLQCISFNIFSEKYSQRRLLGGGVIDVRCLPLSLLQRESKRNQWRIKIYAVGFRPICSTTTQKPTDERSTPPHKIDRLHWQACCFFFSAFSPSLRFAERSCSVVEYVVLLCYRAEAFFAETISTLKQSSGRIHVLMSGKNAYAFAGELMKRQLSIMGLT